MNNANINAASAINVDMLPPLARDALDAAAEAERAEARAHVLLSMGADQRDVFKALATSMAEVIAAVEAFAKEMRNMPSSSVDQSAPTNRHMRRAAKHSKPMKSGDQSWHQRNRYQQRNTRR